MKYLSLIEAILFLVGDDGIEISEISKILNISKEETANSILALNDLYQEHYHGIELFLNGKIIKFVTKKEHYPMLLKLISQEKQKNLSQASLEVLAIIAYNNDDNITKSRVGHIRGVNSDHIINSLVIKELVEYGGRLEEQVGRPFILKITNKFLDIFNISDLNELPLLPKIENENETDHNIFDSSNQFSENKDIEDQEEKSVLEQEDVNEELENIDKDLDVLENELSKVNNTHDS